jgi:hypothetical protein
MTKKYFLASIIAFAITSPLIATTQSPRFEGQVGLTYSQLNVPISVGLFLTERKSSFKQTINDDDMGDLNFKSTYTNLYLDVPLLYRHRVTKDLTLFGGGYIGFLISAKAKVELEGLSGSGEADIKELYNTTSLGISLGATYTISKWTLSGSYFTDLTDAPKEQYGEGKFNGFTTSLGYAF